MILQAEPNEWTQDDARNLKAFLSSPTGQLAIQWIEFRLPVLLDGSHPVKALVSSGELKGYQRALSELAALCFERPEPVKVDDNFPDLDDDSKWTHVDPRRPQS